MNIWEEYKARYPDDDINKDGIINNQKYKIEKWKILTILKETNTLAEPLISFLRRGGEGGGCYTWTPMCKWLGAILDGTLGDFSSKEDRKRILSRTATINLKKVPGTSVSSHSYISFARKNVDLLLGQIKTIPYNIIILCCDKAGKNFILENLVHIDSVWIKVDERLEYTYTKDQIIIIKARHPNRASSKYIDSFLKMHEILKNKM